MLEYLAVSLKRRDSARMKKQEPTRPIVIRYAIAFIGAASITIAMLLFMNDLVNRFILRDPVQYFAIANFFPAPDRGRQLPDAPPSPLAAPIAPELEDEIIDAVVVDAPVGETDPAQPTAEQLFNLEE
jgi:hypothetical protein